MSINTSSINTVPTTTFDVAIVGGGPAGLSAALALGRSLRSVVVLDAGRPRNAPAAGAHNLLGHEGIAPTELLTIGRSEVTAYGVEIRDTEVTGIRRDTPDNNGHFVIDTADGSVAARRVLLATGLVDELPDVPGVADLWGSHVLHCPYCHGYEVRGKRIGVLGGSPMSTHQTMMFRQLSDDVTLFTHTMPPLSDQERQQLSALDIRIVDGTVSRIDADADADALRAVVMADGTRVGCDDLVVAPRFVVRSDLYTQLGGVLADHPMGQVIPTDRMGATDVPGVWAAGNNTDLAAMVSVSMGAGVMAGAAINANLIAEDAAAALARATADA